MTLRSALVEFSDVLDLTPLPWSSSVKSVVLSKRDDRIETTRSVFQSLLPKAIRRSIPARQYEYILGRLAVDVLISECGVTSAGGWISSAERRPIWPAKVAGSITHSNELIWVSVCIVQTSEAAIGTDVESLAQSRSAFEALTVCFSAEEERLISAVEHGRLIGFSAKEALFKCLNPICDIYFDFLDAEIVKLDDVAQKFEVELKINLAIQLPKKTLLRGNYKIIFGHVWTGIEWQI
ncbi:4'-phosphopantetheinyl transferase family protein [Polaromonas sp. P5_D5]